ncbi:MAG: SpoIIE family protein phosphatase [Cyanobacteriota bacterium]|nr:SpoIIE family protein phosphatase [Cyanobacteriota bacterium]
MTDIFILDENLPQQRRLQRLLVGAGFRVAVFDDADTALQQAPLLEPSLIICGAEVGGRAGARWSREFKALTAVSPLFFLLSEPRHPQGGNAPTETGVDDLLIDGAPISEWLLRVRKGLEIHHLQRELQTQKRDFERQKHRFELELREAADYVCSVLPQPLQWETPRLKLEVNHCFVPCQQLGGDGFDYTLIDENKYLVVYLLDVAGHGLRAALPSISVINLLRSKKLKQVDFHRPSSVLLELNQVFQTNTINDKYFTIWYGVIDLEAQTLTYASAGHPPALLLSQNPEGEVIEERLSTQGFPVGVFPDTFYEEKTIQLKTCSSLYLFSDGLYEVDKGNGAYLGFESFTQLLRQYHQSPRRSLGDLLQLLQENSQQPAFEDDLSLIQIEIGGP